MHHRFPSETLSEDGDSQLQHSSGGFLDMLYGDNEGSYTHTKFPDTQTIQGDANMPQGYASEDKESAPPSKKRLRAATPKIKNKKKVGPSPRTLHIRMRAQMKKREINKDLIGRNIGL